MSNFPLAAKYNQEVVDMCFTSQPFGGLIRIPSLAAYDGPTGLNLRYAKSMN